MSQTPRTSQTPPAPHGLETPGRGSPPQPEPMGVGSTAFARVALGLVDDVARSQHDGVVAAAALVADCLVADGVLQAFGTGHSEAFAMEIAGRAGGLVPTNRLSLRDVAVPDPEGRAVSDQFLERDPGTALRIYEQAPAIRPTDVFLIASSSGGNGSIVELALHVKAQGHPLVAVTSMAHTTAITSRHPSGKRLFEVADVVLDNGAPYGDAVLPLPGGGAACGVSSITAALLAQMVVADAIAALLAASPFAADHVVCVLPPCNGV
ncbi:MAG: sugar isomerase domain-containing protein, partial [Actinomycetota bacterium]|nr:sugar isomerase domain-containing protein [Actinomycetota bacterium]